MGKPSAPPADPVARPGRFAGLRRRRGRLAVATAAVAVVAVLGGVALATPGGDNAANPATSTAAAAAAPGTASAPPGAATPTPGRPGWAPTTPDPRVTGQPEARSALSPVSVRAPSIGMQSTLIKLGVDSSGVLIPPVSYDIAGWFTGGPVPGDVGPAIIAGHVDSVAGPGVFFRLKDMRPGDPVAVTRSDGSVVRFTVRRVESYPKTDFPTQRVYGPTPEHELRLITCGGVFDRSNRSYLNNIVVYAVQDAPST